jgi:hypothetical protein
MKPKVGWLFFAFACSQSLSSGALIYVDLSSVPAYQNQSTPEPSPPVSGVNVSSNAVSISNITVGGGTYSFDFTISDSLGSSGLVEKMVRLDSRLNDVELVYTEGPPEHTTALALGSTVNSGSAWYTTSDKSLLLTRHVVVLGSSVEQGQWIDGQEHYAGFRFVDGGSYYYGYIGLTVTTFDTTPTLSISGYAYESTANQGVTISAIPEPATTTVWMAAGGFLFAAIRWVRLRRGRAEGGTF